MLRTTTTLRSIAEGSITQLLCDKTPLDTQVSSLLEKRAGPVLRVLHENRLLERRRELTALLSRHISYGDAQIPRNLLIALVKALYNLDVVDRQILGVLIKRIHTIKVNDLHALFGIMRRVVWKRVFFENISVVTVDLEEKGSAEALIGVSKVAKGGKFSNPPVCEQLGEKLVELHRRNPIFMPFSRTATFLHYLRCQESVFLLINEERITCMLATATLPDLLSILRAVTFFQLDGSIAPLCVTIMRRHFHTLRVERCALKPPARAEFIYLCGEFSQHKSHHSDISLRLVDRILTAKHRFSLADHDPDELSLLLKGISTTLFNWDQAKHGGAVRMQLQPCEQNLIRTVDAIILEFADKILKGNVSAKTLCRACGAFLQLHSQARTERTRFPLNSFSASQFFSAVELCLKRRVFSLSDRPPSQRSGLASSLITLLSIMSSLDQGSLALYRDIGGDIVEMKVAISALEGVLLAGSLKRMEVGVVVGEVLDGVFRGLGGLRGETLAAVFRRLVAPPFEGEVQILRFIAALRRNPNAAVSLPPATIRAVLAKATHHALPQHTIQYVSALLIQVDGAGHRDTAALQQLAKSMADPNFTHTVENHPLYKKATEKRSKKEW